MATSIYDVDIPSNLTGLLASLVGRKLVNIIRFNYVPEKELIEDYYMEPKEFFCCSLGPFLFYFEDGLVIGGISDSGQNTVRMWVEKKENGEHSEWLQEEDEDAVPFYAKDYDDWKIYLNQVVKSVTIIKQTSETHPMIMSLPSERGVLLEFENGSGFIMSHGLNDHSDDTTLVKMDGIHPFFDGNLIYIPVV
ncbi:hypothetical protein I6E61_03770 [Psychrobacter sp. NZS113]|uniref:hypothetical protein n=1 Tax=Psychrobacter sp. NZS113 TaxID=2792045 RepID=UPI0018CED4A4|nr:hypothetical protein [Psychrobacter sp. NZS113]MBH0095500.1 hypothetical protein [Psychrobacter sp. NZS113]